MWKKQRQQSYFYNMRKFHNGIKRDLYNQYTNSKNVLELSIGKGGDLGKLFENKVTRVVGYDIDANSITEAKRRLTEYPNDFQEKVELHVLDLSTNVLSGNGDFDVISCMFAMHYFFKSEDTFLTILSSIENNLRVGGILMGTFFDGKSLINRLNAPFNDPTHFKLTREVTNETLFGNTINVLLKDNIDISSAEIYNPEDEYIVDFERFTLVMGMLGFELIQSDLFSKLNNDYKLNKTERDVSFLNRTFVFKRVADINRDLEKIYDLMKK